jgi:protoporphyrinogen oxidase
MNDSSAADTEPVVVLGAGPAGLAAAYTLARRGRSVVVVERADAVGGLSRSIDFAGARLDLGQHFFTAGVGELADMRRELLGADEIFLTQRTRMYWRGQLVGYPPGLRDVTRAVGIVEAGRIGLSFLASKRRRRRPPANYADRARAAFGDEIFETCLRGYVEKLWDVPCESIEPGWEPGRIKSVSLVDLVRRLLTRRTDDVVMSVARHGSGQFYEAMADDARRHGAQILLGHEVCETRAAGDRVAGVVVRCTGDDERRTIRCSDVISTIPMTVLADQLHVPRRGAEHATPRFRSTVLVYLLVMGDDLFPDHSIYVNDPLLSVGRVTNFSNWGEAMHQGRGRTVLCAELWCDHHDATWAADDGSLVKQAVRELHHIGLLAGQAIEEHRVIRIPNTHPVPEIGATDSLAQLRDHLARFRNLHLAGRSGAFVYRDMDAAVMVGTAVALALDDADNGS